MALKGEGDPRWVVRERQDGTNCGKWHWEDKNVSAWAHERIKELLKPELVTVAPKPGTHEGAKMTEISSVEGDATLYNRKGVLKVLYDLKVNGKWTSCHEIEDDRTHGTFKYELFDEDPEVIVTFDSKSKCDAIYKTFINKALQPVVVQTSRTFIKELHAGGGASLEGIRLPEPKRKPTETKVTDYLRSGMDQKTSKPIKKDLSTCELNISEKFLCSSMDLYKVLTEQPRLEAITRTKAVSTPVVGGEFDLMKGTVTGRYLELQPGEKISMTWKMKTWNVEGEGSLANVSMSQDDNYCILNVRLERIPAKYKTETEGFWRVQIFQSIKIIMGYGSASGFF